MTGRGGTGSRAHGGDVLRLTLPSHILPVGRQVWVEVSGGRPPYRARWIAPNGAAVPLPVRLDGSGHLVLSTPPGFHLVGSEDGWLVVTAGRERAVTPLTVETGLSNVNVQRPPVRGLYVPVFLFLATLVTVGGLALRGRGRCTASRPNKQRR